MALAHGENVTDVREITESDETVMMENRRFTNTALPIFSGTEGWYVCDGNGNVGDPSV